MLQAIPTAFLMYGVITFSDFAAQTPAPPSPPPASAPASKPAATEPDPIPASRRMKAEALAMRDMMTTDLGRTFLEGARGLPVIAPRTVYREKKSRQWFSPAQKAAALAADPALEFIEMQIGDDRYYDTKYGSPVAYARAFDLLGKTGLKSFDGLHILDIGYGTIGHLRMLATMRADVTGLDVDSFLTALYSDPSDTGVIRNPEGEDGRITLVNGTLDDDDVKRKVGDGYDLIIAKNTLKRGYIHPPADVKVDPRQLVNLGLDDEAFLRTLFDALKPGGHLMIYNICPKQNDYEHGQPYSPWADGRSPFSREQFEKAGFRVGILDRDDSESCRAMAKILGWDQGEGAMDLQSDLFAHFTLVEKPGN